MKDRSGNELSDTPREALAAYILELERDYSSWYEASSGRWKVMWGVGQTTALLAGILSSVLAAAADQAALQRFGAIRTALIVLPALGAFAASLLGQTRARELLALRERGRATIQEIISRAKADYAASAGHPERLFHLHKALIDEINRLEHEQATEFLSLAPGASTTHAEANRGRSEHDERR